MEVITDLINAVSMSKQKSVLATIIHVEGRAYLKEGTSMLIFEDETCFGMLSPGCLEEDILKRSSEIFIDSIPRIHTYDMSDENDFGWGRGTGCNGKLSILLEPVTEQLKADFQWVKEHLFMGKSVLHIKHFSQNLTLEKFEFIEVDKFDSSLVPRKSGLQTNEIEKGYSFFHVYEPKRKLIIYGAGNDSKPLVSLAVSTGFQVIICDWRSGLCSKENFPEADEVIVGKPSEIVNNLLISERDFVIIMSHDYRNDKEFLQLIVEKDVGYIGVLGPRERTERLLNNKLFPPRLFSPIGLSIDAKGPNEIAISIMAEVIKVNHSKSYMK